MYSRNIQSLLVHSSRTERSTLDLDDEITRETCVTHAGEVVHEASGVAPHRALELDRVDTVSVVSRRVFLGIELISTGARRCSTRRSCRGRTRSTASSWSARCSSPAPRTRPLEKALAFIAVVFGTVNVVGGFLVTDRMLQMFKRKPERRREPGMTLPLALSQNVVNLMYVVAASASSSASSA